MAGDPWSDMLSLAASAGQQNSQLQPRPASPNAPPPAPNQGPIVAPIRGAGQGGPPPAPASQPGILGAVGNLVNGVVQGAKDAAGVAAPFVRTMVPGASQPGDAKKIADTAAAAGAAVLRAPGQLVGGALDTYRDSGRFVDDNINGALARVSPQFAANVAKGERLSVGNYGGSLANTLSMRQRLGSVGGPALNQALTQTIAASAASIIPGGPLAKALSVAAVSGATTDVSNQSPGGNLAERGENALAAAALEGVAHFIHAKIAGNTISEATPVEAAGDKLDRDFATQRTMDARYNQVDPKAEPPEQEVVPPGRHSDGQAAEAGVHSDATGTASAAPTGDQSAELGAPASQATASNHPLATDANAALDKAGAAERLDPNGPPTVAPDGTIPVEPDTKATLDDAGMGRAFTDKTVGEDINSDPIIHFKETDPQGGSRVTGSIGRDDLNGFLEDAKRYGANPESIDTTSDHPSGQWSLRPLGSSDDVSAMGRALADRLPPSDGPITHDQTLAAAKEMGFDSPGDAHILASQFSSKTDGLANGLVAARMMQAKINEQLGALHGTDWTTVPLEDPRWVDAHTAYHNGYSFMQAFRQSKSEIARALNATQIPFKNLVKYAAGVKPGDEIPPQPVPDYDTWRNNFGKVPQEDLQPYDPTNPPPLPRNPKEFKDAIDIHEASVKAGPEAENAFWTGKTLAPGALKYLRTSFANFWTAGIVSGVSTFMRDLAGPLVVGGVRTLERTGGGYGAALYESTLGDASKVPDLLASASQAPAAYLRTIGDTADAFKQAVQATKQGHSLLGGPNPVDFNQHGVPQALIDAATQNSGPLMGQAQQFGYSLGNLINKFPQAVHALHGGVNEFALRLAYNGEIRAQALLEASRQGLDADATQAYVSAQLGASTDPLTGLATNEAALASSQRTTFTKPVGDPDLQPIIHGLSSVIQTMRSEVPETRYILPIFTVPANAIGETLRRVPVLGQLFKETQTELSGSMGAARQAEAYGRFMSGAAFMTAGLSMARSGNLTGAGPQEPNARRIWEGQGMQPYSVRLGGKWVSYNRIDVMGPLLGLVAGFSDHTMYNAQDNPNLAYGAVAATAQYFKDQSALKGVSDLLSFGGSPQESQGYLQRLGDDTARGFVPNFITQLARNNADHTARIVRNPWDAILNALPGTSQTLDPVRNLMGEEVQKVPNAGLNTLPISITNVNTYAKDPVADELDRIFVKSGYAPGVISPALGAAHADMRDVKLEDGHSLYDHIGRNLMTVQNEDGQTLRQAVTDLIQSPDYAAAEDGSAKRSTDDEDNPSRAYMLAKTFDEFHKLAKQQTAQDSPVAARWMAVAAAKDKDVASLRTYNAGDLVKNSSLLTSLGVNIGDYEEKVKGQ
jgi:hypothetical protein